MPPPSTFGFGARVRVLLRGGVRGLGGGQAARRERGVQLLPHARRLRAGGGQVQRRRRADRAQVALDVVLVRHRRDRRPLVAVHLLVRHAGVGLSLRHLHPQQRVQAEARLVEQVGLAVFALGDAHLAVAEVAGRRAEAGQHLVLVLQRPDREAAVDQVLAVVAGVVPAAADVQLVAALRLGRAGHALVADVAGGAFVGLRAGVRHLDVDAAALQVEERERVVLELLVDVGTDVERRALELADAQLVALAGGGERREVDLLHALARRLVVAVGARLAAGARLAGLVDELPVERRRRGRRDRRDLGQPRQVADLVDAHGGELDLRRAFDRRLELRIVQLDVVEADGQRRLAGQRAAQLDRQLDVVVVDRAVEAAA